MRASGAAALGVAPGDDQVLAAELMAAHVAAMVEDLRARQALPARLLAADSVVKDWREAARNARTLLSAYSVCFRERKGQAAAEAVAEVGAGGERPRERPPPDSFEVVEVASRAADKQLAVPADMLQGVTSLAALRREHARESSFKDLVSSSQARRDREIAGELQYFVAQYGQEAAAYLVSNGMSVGRVRGAGVPTSLAGARGHLERCARTWVDSVFGRERAADGQYAAEAHRLSLSVLTGVVTGDGPEAAEAAIVQLLGGSKPNERADIRREGGSVSDGTLGSLTGEAAHFSVRTAYHLWAQGVALCLGRVLVAAAAGVRRGARVRCWELAGISTCSRTCSRSRTRSRTRACAPPAGTFPAGSPSPCKPSALSPARSYRRCGRSRRRRAARCSRSGSRIRSTSSPPRRSSTC